VDPEQRNVETVVAEPASFFVILWLGFPLLGAGAAWLLLLISEGVVSLPWVPFQGVFELVASLPDPQATIGSLAVGAVAGLVFAFLGYLEALTVRVSDEWVVTSRQKATSSVVDAASVTDVFVDGKKLVLLGAGGRELVRSASDLKAERLAAAFRAHGYPWRDDGDPYADEFRRWVQGVPGLPAGADALLKARQEALKKGDEHDIAELRQELARLGVVVREEKKRQYWRVTVD
jgi:hypothetical protein